MNQFRSGRNNIENEAHSGRTSISVCEENIDAVHDMIVKRIDE